MGWVELEGFDFHIPGESIEQWRERYEAWLKDGPRHRTARQQEMARRELNKDLQPALMGEADGDNAQ